MSIRANTPASSAINNFLLNTKAKTTKKKEQTLLTCFCNFTFGHSDIFGADWSMLNKEKILRFIEHKMETIQFDSANSYITVLQLLAQECFYYDAIDSLTYNPIRDIKKYRGIPPDKGRALKLSEIKKIKEHFSKTKNGREARNYAIFALAVGCGLRRAEISAINIEHFKGKTLQVIGKGNKARTTYLSKFTLDAVTKWRNQLPQKKGALFVHVSRGDTIKDKRLGIKGIHHVIEEIQDKCNIRKFTTHDLRRTFATTMLKANTDIFTVQDLLGHSDPKTTRRYDKRGNHEKIRAINSLPF